MALPIPTAGSKAKERADIENDEQSVPLRYKTPQAIATVWLR